MGPLLADVGVYGGILLKIQELFFSESSGLYRKLCDSDITIIAKGRVLSVDSNGLLREYNSHDEGDNGSKD